ncbi:MAG TPA: hypothetical protein VGS01_12525 [Candidatus Limnocylindria bacterium]|jgi:hypothetical protein|nr:hypothetical protein [Candidatus Limnocylindria bacterium]
MLAILVPVAVVAVIVIIGVLAFQRGREGFDLSSGTVLRAYLYLGSFAGVVAIAFGVSALLNGALATAVGNEFVYGATPAIRGCPVGVECPMPPVQVALPAQDLLERRRLEDLVRGATFSAFGTLFYSAHLWARRVSYPRGASAAFGDGLRRAYLLLGTVVFGTGAIALLPAAVYQVLVNAILPSSTDLFRPGVADSLSGGLVAFVFWLVYLRAVLRDARGGPRRVYRTGPSGPPAEPAPVGARIGPGPGERSAGAEAQPPQQFAALQTFGRPRTMERLGEKLRERG